MDEKRCDKRRPSETQLNGISMAKHGNQGTVQFKQARILRNDIGVTQLVPNMLE